MTEEMKGFSIYFSLLLTLEGTRLQICGAVLNAIPPASLDSLTVSSLCLTSFTYSEAQKDIAHVPHSKTVRREK